MAFTHGKNSYFALGTAGGETTTVDLSSYIDSIDFPSTVETADVTTFGDDDRNYIVGLRDRTLSLSGSYDPASNAIDEHLEALLGNATAADFDFGPEGNATGATQYSGSAFVTNYNPSTSVGDKVSFTADLQITGAVTRGTF